MTRGVTRRRATPGDPRAEARPSACEAQHYGNLDWYDRFGCIYYQVGANAERDRGVGRSAIDRFAVGSWR